MSNQYWNLAFSPNGKWLVGAKFRGQIDVFDVVQKSKIAEFDSIYAPGGSRLAVGGDDVPKVMVAGWSTRGLACYDGRNGELIWKTKDVQLVHSIELDEFGRISVSCDKMPCKWIDSTTGLTLQRFSRMREIRTIDEVRAIIRNRTEFGVYDTVAQTWIWRRPLGFPWYIAANRELVAAFGDKTLQIIDLNGVQLTTVFLDFDGQFNDFHSQAGLQATLVDLTKERSPMRFWFGLKGETVHTESLPHDVPSYGSAYLSDNLAAGSDGFIYQLQPFQQLWRFEV